ncbi:MAG: LexA family transcriptional regulator [Deltaproteobacteria bacterium]|nr:LexA family transcriptional regulator [Deltaproteobacteria bacterium]
MTINKRIKTLVKRSGLTLQDFAAKVGISKTTLVSYQKGATSPPAKVLQRLCERFGVNPEWLLMGKGPIVLIPLVNFEQAKDGSYLAIELPHRKCAFEKRWLKKFGSPDKMVMVEMPCDDMEPLIRLGDYLIVDTSQIIPKHGKLMVVGVNGCIIIRKVSKHPPDLMLLPSNSLYYPISFWSPGDHVGNCNLFRSTRC